MVTTPPESLFYLASAKPDLTLPWAAFSCRENLLLLLARHARATDQIGQFICLGLMLGIAVHCRR